MCMHRRAPFKPSPGWNPHGFSEKSRVRPIDPPARSAVGAFEIHTEAFVASMWREGSDYKVKLEDESGKEYSGIFYARDFQAV